MQTLKDQLKKELDLKESNFGNHYSDLHVLYSPEVDKWLKDNYEFYCNVVKELANIEGHKWYGKYFLDIPFAHVEKL